MSLSPPNYLPADVGVSEFSLQERRLLVNLAHEAIASAIENRELADIPRLSHFEQPRGVFTTIYLRAVLRGCVGYVFPVKALFETVVDTARASAFQDVRFLPVTKDEAAQLEISLSILSPLQALAPDRIEVGRHGLLITQHGRRGLLLPQVPVEHGWDRITFLEQTCEKAGLLTDAWKNGATLEAFTAEVFGDRDAF
ncbi:MAG: AmmECR1 [Acidobacteriaceae bacterium]|nr:AmmECR1 [Acidobacteriaceae bacterium]